MRHALSLNILFEVIMQKGLDTRNEFLRAAEYLFRQKGYDQTSVQDILDMTHGSKGGFYHHFPSKDAILQTLCSQRAEQFKAHAEEMIRNTDSRMTRINQILHEANPLRKEESSFIRILLPLLNRADGLTVRAVYQDTLISSFSDLLQSEILMGTRDGTLYPCSPDLAVPILCLNNACWTEASQLLSGALQEKVKCTYAMLQQITVRYRRSIELLLDAPYGSIELAYSEDWLELGSALKIPELR